MGNEARARFLHVTWIEISYGAFHVVARCDLCNVVADRRVDNCTDNATLSVVGIEALSAGGCSHTCEVAGSGLRRRVSLPK